MANPSGFLLAISFVLTTLITSMSAVDASGGHRHHLSWLPTLTKSGCHGSMAECMANDVDDFAMDSGISRRILQTTQYISYAALQRNTVPCSRRGASYYNCRPGAEANPYSRGCSAITRCRN